METALGKNFAEASVKVVDCPDLTKSPFGLAGSGLAGSPRVMEVGGVPNLLPTPDKTRIYDMRHLPSVTGMGEGKDGFVIGASAADWTFLKRNAELMPNLLVRADGTCNQRTFLARTHDKDGSYEQVLV